MMSEYDEKRKTELLSLLERKGLDKLDTDIDHIIELENEMTNHKNMVMALIESGIISDLEFDIKIAKCFDVFLTKIASKFGEPLCRAIYDYLPGEELGFLVGYKENNLASIATKVLDSASSLKEFIESHHDGFIQEDAYLRLLHDINHISYTSTEVIKGINKEQQLISDIEKRIAYRLEIIDTNPVFQEDFSWGKPSVPITYNITKPVARANHLSSQQDRRALRRKKLRVAQRYADFKTTQYYGAYGNTTRDLKLDNLFRDIESEFSDVKADLISIRKIINKSEC